MSDQLPLPLADIRRIGLQRSRAEREGRLLDQHYVRKLQSLGGQLSHAVDDALTVEERVIHSLLTIPVERWEAERDAFAGWYVQNPAPDADAALYYAPHYLLYSLQEPSVKHSSYVVSIPFASCTGMRGTGPQRWRTVVHRNLLFPAERIYWVSPDAYQAFFEATQKVYTLNGSIGSIRSKRR